MNIGRFEIRREIGKGSMGVIYEARDPRMGRSVALKVLRADRLASPEFVARFLREARAVGRLTHPNIVTVYDSGQDGDRLFIVMEFVDGRTLADRKREGRLTLQEVVQIGVQAAEALDYAHRHRIVHRDVKPSNILLAADGRVKLTDFGIARCDDPDLLGQTLAGDILGTPVYMSPEQVSGEALDGRSDLYSLGVVLCELATGIRPYRGMSLAEVFSAILEEPERPPELPDTPVGRRLAELIQKSTRKEPSARFQTGAEMAEALKSCLKRRKSDAESEERAPHPPPSPARRGERRAARIAAGGAAALALAAGLFFFAAPEAPRDRPPVGADSPPAAAATPPAAPPTARIEVASEPPGADLYVDGHLHGATPIALDLALGPHEVRLSSPGHFDWEARLDLEREGRTPLVIHLVPMAEKSPNPTIK